MAYKLPNIALFCYEAGKEPDRYLGVGGLDVTSVNARAIRAEFEWKEADLGLSKAILYIAYPSWLFDIIGYLSQQWGEGS